MFTGIIEQKGCVQTLSLNQGMTRLELRPEEPEAFQVALGDSVAVNGVCLTVVANEAGLLSFDLSRETLQVTTLGRLVVGSMVNMERALLVSERLGGHLVAGHIDGIAEVLFWEKEATGWRLDVRVPRELSRYVAPKGSICLDGVSLTVNAVMDRPEDSVVTLMLIPLTLERTNLDKCQVGDCVNLETDLVARYLERLSLR